MGLVFEFVGEDGDGGESGAEAEGKVVLVNIVMLELRIPKTSAVPTYMAKLEV